MHTELRIDVAHVALHRWKTDEKLLGYGCGIPSRSQQLHYFFLSLRQVSFCGDIAKCIGRVETDDVFRQRRGHLYARTMG